MREVEPDAGLLLNGSVIMELGPVISSDRGEPEAMLANQRDDPPTRLVLGPVSEFADEHVSSFAFDDSDDTMIVTAADDGIDLPMTSDAPGFNGNRALIDQPLACEPASRIVGVMALPSLLRRLPQVLVKRTACGFVSPDVLIDRFV